MAILIVNFNDPAHIGGLETQAIKNPRNMKIRTELVNIFLTQGNFEDAQKYLREAEQIYADSLPDICNAQLSYLRGLYFDYLDNIPAAMEYYADAVECDSTFSGAWRRLAYIHEIFSNGEQMLYCFQKALPFTDDYPGLLYDMGVAYDMLDSLPQAIACYHQVLALCDSIPEAYLNLGTDWGVLGYPDSANQYFGLAATAGLKKPELYFNIGVMKIDAGEFNQAIDNFMKVLAIDPYYSPAKLQLGNLYETLGDSDMAKLYYEEFVQTAPLLYSDDINSIKEKLAKYPRQIR